MHLDDDGFMHIVCQDDASEQSQAEDILNLHLSDKRFSANEVRCYIEKLISVKSSEVDARKAVVYKIKNKGWETAVFSPCSDNISLIARSNFQDMPTLENMMEAYHQEYPDDTPDEILIPFAQNSFFSKHWVMIRVKPKKSLIEYYDPRPASLSEYICCEKTYEALSILAAKNDKSTAERLQPQHLDIQSIGDFNNCGRYVCAMLKESIDKGDEANLKNIELLTEKQDAMVNVGAFSLEDDSDASDNLQVIEEECSSTVSDEKMSFVLGMLKGVGMIITGTAATIFGAIGIVVSVSASAPTLGLGFLGFFPSLAICSAGIFSIEQGKRIIKNSIKKYHIACEQQSNFKQDSTEKTERRGGADLKQDSETLHKSTQAASLAKEEMFPEISLGEQLKLLNDTGVYGAENNSLFFNFCGNQKDKKTLTNSTDLEATLKSPLLEDKIKPVILDS